MNKKIKVKPEWQIKPLAEWLKMFPEDTPIEIHSYGVWDSTFGSIKHFNEDLEREKKNIFSDGRTKSTSKATVKRIFQDSSDPERLIFDTRGNSVHLWNKTLMENKDPSRDMMPGLRVPLRNGVDVDSIFHKRMDEWSSKPFYIDAFAMSCLSNIDCLEVDYDS